VALRRRALSLGQCLSGALFIACFFLFLGGAASLLPEARVVRPSCAPAGRGTLAAAAVATDRTRRDRVQNAFFDVA